MNSAMFQQFLQSAGVLGALLMVGAILRAKVPIFQQLLLPASVIGGFIGLLLGPVVMGDMAILKFSEDWITMWSIIPGILIVPIFSAVPLGMFMGEKKEGNTLKRMGPKALISLGLFAAVGGLQSVMGYTTNLIFSRLQPSLDLYRTFGWELSQGFAGGHGMAGGVGGILEGFGLDYWQTAQGVAMTTATIGLIGGMIGGIFLTNRAARQGKTKLLSTPGQIPLEIKQGYNSDVKTQKSLGRETMVGSSIETISVHLSLMLFGCTLAYWVRGFLQTTPLSAMANVPVWFFALLIMYGVNYILIKCKLSWMIDTRVKARITSSMSDFAIVAAIASVPVRAIIAYALPMAVMCLLGFAVTYLITFPLFRYCFKDDFPFERAIMSWGVNTGVMITGMMLLKICDPNYESPVINDFSMGFSLMSIVSLLTSPIMFTLLATAPTTTLLTFDLFVACCYLGVALIGRRLLIAVNKTA